MLSARRAWHRRMPIAKPPRRLLVCPIHLVCLLLTSWRSNYPTNGPRRRAGVELAKRTNRGAPYPAVQSFLARSMETQGRHRLVSCVLPTFTTRRASQRREPLVGFTGDRG